MTPFHRQLLISTLRNLVRSGAVLLVIIVTLGMPGFFESAVSTGARGASSHLLRLLLVLEFILPLALLLAVLFTVSSLARNHELTALRAAGWSMAQIMYPVFLVAMASFAASVALRTANPSLFEPSSSGAAAGWVAPIVFSGVAGVLWWRVARR